MRKEPLVQDSGGAGKGKEQSLLGSPREVYSLAKVSIKLKSLVNPKL